MRRLHKFVRFIADTALDVAIPDFLALPYKIANGLYRCFLAADPREQLEMLLEARQLSPAETDEAVELLLKEWQERWPGLQVTPPLREAARKAVLSMAQANKAGDPAEALRQSLNGTLLAGGHALAPADLDPAQRAVGRLLASRIGHAGASIPQAAQLALPGYEMLRVIGQGAFATVHLARHAASGELRAVKVGKVADPRRLRREIELVEKVQSPHLVRYHEHGQLEGHFWLAMDYLGGQTLGQLIAVRPDTEQALLLAEQVLRGLAALHEAGVLHRDLKPENVMVDDDFRLRLIDFGLARPLDEAGAGSLGGVTVAGELVGTPFYMSPEQVRGEAALGAADVWAFGVILFELLTNERPFKATTIMGLGAEILTREVNLDRPEIPAGIRPVLGKCLARDVPSRYQTAAEALLDFAACSTGARRGLRHERFRAPWVKVIEGELLERFAAAGDGTVGGFVAFAAAEGCPPVDEERLAQILPAVLAARAGVEAATRRLAEKRRWLGDHIAGLPTDAIARAGQEMKELEQAREKAEADVSAVVRRELAAEARSWEEELAERQKAEAERQKAEAAERKRRDEAADRARREREEAEAKSREERAERDREARERLGRLSERAAWGLAGAAVWAAAAFLLGRPSGSPVLDGFCIAAGLLASILGLIGGGAVASGEAENEPEFEESIGIVVVLLLLVGGVGALWGWLLNWLVSIAWIASWCWRTVPAPTTLSGPLVCLACLPLMYLIGIRWFVRAFILSAPLAFLTGLANMWSVWLGLPVAVALAWYVPPLQRWLDSK